jgi:hypothetical protein
MRLVPILDTNVFVNAGKGIITAFDWSVFRRSLPKSGCPLSAITLGELLAGLAGCDREMFSQSQQALHLARSISKGRILDQPKTFVWKNVFRAPYPGPGLDTKKLHLWLELACRAKTKKDLVESKLPDRRTLRRGRRYVGLDLPGIAIDTFAD